MSWLSPCWSNHRSRTLHVSYSRILRISLVGVPRGFVVLLGFLQAVYTLEGCETAAQVAEEAKRAQFLAPLAVVGSIVGSWLVGLAYMLALLSSVQNIASVQASTYAIPIAQLFYDAVGAKLTVMCLVVVGLAQFMASVTAFTASSRLFYALARDNAFPEKDQFMAINRFQAPYWGVWMSVLVGCTISCAYIGSAVAFNAILSSAAIAVMLSYLQPIAIRTFWPDSYVVVDSSFSAASDFGCALNADHLSLAIGGGPSTFLAFCLVCSYACCSYYPLHTLSMSSI